MRLGYLTQEESDKQDYILHMNHTHIFIVAFTYNFSITRYVILNIYCMPSHTTYSII